MGNNQSETFLHMFMVCVDYNLCDIIHITNIQRSMQPANFEFFSLQICGSVIAFIIRYHLVRFFYDIEQH